jgi:dTDP-4-dehydrorhamnose reductase
MTSDASQRGTPTFAPDVARQIVHLLDAEVRGTFNLVAHGAASRFDYVAEIVRASGLPCAVEPGPAFERLAKVSSNETAVNLRLGLLGLDGMSDWRRPLGDYVAGLMDSPEWRALP